jgi:hypothetical protein
MRFSERGLTRKTLISTIEKGAFGPFFNNGAPLQAQWRRLGGANEGGGGMFCRWASNAAARRLHIPP